MKLIEKKISIIICCKDNTDYLKNVLDSFNKQKYKNLELIICFKNSVNQKLPYLNNLNFKKKYFFKKIKVCIQLLISQ